MQVKSVLRILGVLWMILGLFMILVIPVIWYYQSNDLQPMLYAMGLCFGLGGIAFMIGRKATVHINKRTGYFTVALGWITMAFLCMLPFIFSGYIPSASGAFFESMSGLTTTGASVLTNIEAVPKGILFWRSLIQWIGGMGIIVLTVALFPLLGIGGFELFIAEVPGPTSDKIHPKTRDTARTLWVVYVVLTLLLFLALRFAGMTGYDAINHALTTMATGGFSTKNASIAAFDQPLIHYVLIGGMFTAGTNFTLIYYGFRGRFRKIWQSDEFKTYLIFILGFSFIVSIFVYRLTDQNFEKSFRDSLFQVVSVITTTGFVTADYTSWSTALTMFFFILLFIGGCAGSTAGGIKIIRHLVFIKNSVLEFKRILHPRALIRIKIDKQMVAPRLLTHILVFLLLYLLSFLFGSVLVAFLGLDFESAVGATITCLSNVGPGIGSVGPVYNFADVPDLAKWVLSLLMLIGRLELFTILILFTPYFWKKN